MSGGRDASIEIRLFGTPIIMSNGRARKPRSRKATALLAYLAVRADEHIARSHLAALLWADNTQEQARANLRQTLSQLRKTFREAGQDPILVPFDQVVLESRDLIIDVKSLADENADETRETLCTQPEFLEGFSVRAPEFESWLTAQRQQYRTRKLQILVDLAEQAEEQGQIDKALDSLTLAVRIDPLQEDLHRRLMKLFAGQDRTDAALAQFETCRRVLRSELDVEPEIQTRELLASIRKKRTRAAEPRDTGGNGARSGEPISKFPPDMPTIVFTDDGESRRFSSATEALRNALEVSRGNIGGSPRAIAVAPDMDDGDTVKNSGLLNLSVDGSVVVGIDVFDKFRNWSPFAFESIFDEESRETIAYRLVSEMPRHRLLFDPNEDRPVNAPTSEFSVAVLPLRDSSPDAAEVGLGDVIAEEITVSLSRFHNLFVASSSAGFACAKQGISPLRIGSTLGVNYLVDGGVRRLGDKIELTISLTNLRDQQLVFSDSYEGRFGDLFSKQDELIAGIASTILRRAEDAEIRRVQKAPTSDMGAYDLFLRGLALHRRAGIHPDNARQAFGYFTKAIEIDPEFARAYAWRICTVSWFNREYFEDPGLREIHYALSLDEQDAEIQRIAGALHLYRGDYELGLEYIQAAVRLSPNDAYLLASSAVYWSYYGEPERGLPFVERAMRLDPFLPVWCVEDYGVTLYSMANYEDAISAMKRLTFPTSRSLCYIAASHVALDQIPQANEAVRQVHRISPGYSAAQFMSTVYYRLEEQTTALIDRLAVAGLS
jgi:DNA-binding SARP family transcriptional activator/TolB-like protein